MHARDIIKEIKKIGKKKGLLSYEDVYEALPPDLFARTEIVKIIAELEEQGITVTNKPADQIREAKAEPEASAGDLTSIARKALEKIRLKLLDLSKRNRLLNFRETARSIRIVDELPNETFDFLVNERKGIVLVPFPEKDETDAPDSDSDDSSEFNSEIKKNHELPTPNGEVKERHRDNYLQTPLTAKPLETRCKRILQESRTAIDETGSNLLYLAIGFLEWYEADESSVPFKAPLILVPVQLERSRIDRRTNCYNYVLSYTEEDIETNLSLVEKLSRDFDLILPTLDEDKTAEKYFEELSNTIRHKRRWRVAREMITGMFSFTKLLMYKDLDPKNWPESCRIDKHKHITGILAGNASGDVGDCKIYGEEYDIDKNPQAFNIPLIRDADSSQHSAIVDVLNNIDLVIDGPPGTGKSQTISNVIAAALHKGKSVLFLAEKKAALEVVRRRLDQAGIGDFCLELHSHKTQKGKLHADLKKRLERTFPNPARIDQDIQDLIKERDKLHHHAKLMQTSAGPNEETIYDILWAAERWHTETDGQQVNFSVTNPLKLTRDQILDRTSILEDISRLYKDLPDAVVRAWSGFRPLHILPGDEETVYLLLLSMSEQTSGLVEFMNGICINKEFPHFQKIGFIFEISSITKEGFNNLPSFYDETLAIKFIEPSNRKTTYELNDSIHEYRNLMNKALHVLDRKVDLDSDIVGQIQLSMGRLEAKNYSDISIDALSGFPEIAENVLSSIQALQGIADKIQEITNQCPENINDFLFFISLVDHLNAAPEDIEINCHPAHTLPVAEKLINDVKSELVDLREKIKSYSKIFHLSRLPEHKETKHLADILRRHSRKLFAFLNPEFRKARISVTDFLVESKSIRSSDTIEKLYEIVNILDDADTARRHADYSRILGHHFKGIHTDWPVLERHVNWAQELRKTLGSQSQAEKILCNINSYRDKANNLKQKNYKFFETVVEGLSRLRLDMDKHQSMVKTFTIIDELRREIIDALKIVEGHVLDRNLDVSSINRAADAWLSAHQLQISIETDSRHANLLGSYFQGINTNTDEICLICDWVALLQKKEKMPSIILKWLVEKETRDRLSILDDFIEKSSNYKNHLNSICSKLNDLGQLVFDQFFGSSVEECLLDQAFRKAKVCIENLNYLVTWSDYCRAIDRALEMNLGEIIKALESKLFSPDKTVANYLAGIYRSMARAIIQKHSELSSFTRSAFENTRKRFIDLDRKIILQRGQQIATGVSKRPIPRGIGYGYVSDWTNLALINREIQKKKKHIPIRQLIRRSVMTLQALKPCFMMSPLSVAQYLVPGTVSFDLVIMDEASQIKPEDSLGAIARSKQVIVVGDENQLPPTTFFERINEIAYDEEETALEDTESILDRCKSIFRRRCLKWHYRSEHESLIAFSNRQFYDNNLVVFPSPFRKVPYLGVRSEYVKGATYSNGKNLVEAEAVVTGAIKHFRDNPQDSLGVVTFNREQRELIEDVLEKYQKSEPWIERTIKETENSEEPFFIKNLENVQGDERDVIIISTTFGPDADTKKVYQRFGPLSGNAGWRRLNVMFTRAKKSVNVFTSMLPTDLNITDETPRGVRELRAYLEYSKSGYFPDFGLPSEREPESDFEISVAKVLNSYGYKTVPQVGVAGFFIDMGVLHPERENEFILGIECDGAGYHSAKSVRDRDRLRQEILEKKHWKIHRIWSTDWFKNRQIEIDRLLKTIREIIEDDKSRVYPVYPEYETIGAAQIENDEDTLAHDETISKSIRGNDDELRAELTNYHQNNIARTFTDRTNGILRDEMVECFIKLKPTTMEEFRSKIPLKLREHTDRHQVQFLPDIFEIIEQYA